MYDYLDMPDPYVNSINRMDKGVSPFIYHNDMTLTEPSSDIELSKGEILRELRGVQRINDFQLDIVYCIHRFSCLSGHILKRMLFNKYPGRDFSDALNKLVRRNILVRRQCRWSDKQSPYIYNVQKNFAEYLVSSGAETSGYTEDAVSMISLICRNQFAAAAECRDYFIKSEINTKTVFKGKKVNMGYSVVIEGNKWMKENGGRNIRLIPIAVRRSDKWEDKAIERMIKALLYRDKDTISFPTFICEDIDHMKTLGRAVSVTKVLSGRLILFCVDDGTKRWDIANCLLAYYDGSVDGAVSFKKYPLYPERLDEERDSMREEIERMGMDAYLLGDMRQQATVIS